MFCAHYKVSPIRFIISPLVTILGIKWLILLFGKLSIMATKNVNDKQLVSSAGVTRSEGASVGGSGGGMVSSGGGRPSLKLTLRLPPALMNRKARLLGARQRTQMYRSKVSAAVSMNRRRGRPPKFRFDCLCFYNTTMMYQ